MTTTPNYAYTLPAVGGDFEIWGDELNANWAKIDDDLKDTADQIDGAQIAADAALAQANLKVAKAGDTMTGPLVLPTTEPSSTNHATRKQYVDAGELSQVSRYLFSAGLTDADPGSGKIGFNNADGKLATLIFVSSACFNGKSTPIPANFVAGVYIGLSNVNRTVYYRVTAVVDHTAWYTLTVVALTTAIAFAPAADSSMLLTFLGFKETTAPVATVTCIEHDLGSAASVQSDSMPSGNGDVTWHFKCTSTSAGYSSGDYVAISSFRGLTGGGTPMPIGAVSHDNNTLSYVPNSDTGGANPTQVCHKTSGSMANISLSSWHVVARVWKAPVS